MRVLNSERTHPCDEQRQNGPQESHNLPHARVASHRKHTADENDERESTPNRDKHEYLGERRKDPIVVGSCRYVYAEDLCSVNRERWGKGA